MCLGLYDNFKLTCFASGVGHPVSHSVNLRKHFGCFLEEEGFGSLQQECSGSLRN